MLPTRDADRTCRRIHVERIGADVVITTADGTVRLDPHAAFYVRSILDDVMMGLAMERLALRRD